MLHPRIPDGPLNQKCTQYRSTAQLVSPSTRKKLQVVVVGAGLSGSALAASLAEMGYLVRCFCFQDSARLAHSIAAQGGVNVCKNYKNDGDTVFRMFNDTIKGGDYRSRGASVYRLAGCSIPLTDQVVAKGVPFAREYSSYLSNRSFGGVQVSSTFYARGQTGQQMLLGAYQGLLRQVAAGASKLFARHEMLDLVAVDGKARGIIAQSMDTGALDRHGPHAAVLATGGFGKIYYLSTLAMGCNASAFWRAHKRGAYIANPSWTQIHPTCLPQSGEYQSKCTLMSESLRNDGRLCVPRNRDEQRSPNEIPGAERDYYLERRYPAFGNLSPRDTSSRAAKERIDASYGVGPLKNAVYLDFTKAISEQGLGKIKEKYGNLFRMYEKITGVAAYKEPMRISPAAHFSMGGLWVDYELMSNPPELFAIGEANFADHGASRLGANSLLQARLDGSFIAPATVPSYLANEIKSGPVDTAHPAFDEAEKSSQEKLQQLLGIAGQTPVDHFHKALGKILYDKFGLSRSAAGLEAAVKEIRSLRDQFNADVSVPSGIDMNSELEKAGRVADLLELGELMCHDALTREESCGAHFRVEYQTPDGEAVRNDRDFAFTSAWEWTGVGSPPGWHGEPLTFETVAPSVRSYK